MIYAPHIWLRQGNKSFRHSIPQNFLYEGALQLYKKHLVIPFIAVSLVLSIVSCSRQGPVEPPISAPGISVQITKDDCPSIEVEAGMQVTWTNVDHVDRALIVERTDEQGVVVSAGGTDRLGPGDSFSTSFDVGQYPSFCSEDRTTFGTITVLPASYPYP